MFKMIGVATALTLAAVPAFAQHHPEHRTGQQPGMQRMQGMQDDMAAMHLMAFQPDQLLAQRADLKLTAEQVTRLERIAADAKTKHDQAKATHDQHQQELMGALTADNPSADAVGAHFRAAHEAMGAAHWAELESGLAAMAALTPEQRTTVKSWSHGMECCKKP
jgi:Spy/CpxP family protein refolding chaperone